MSHELQALLPYVVNFSLVIVILAVVVRKPLRKYVYQRHERMRDAVESATAAHRKATARIEAAKGALSGLVAEESRIRQAEAASTDGEKREILEKAQAEASRLLREAERLAAAEQDESSERVKEEFLGMVVRETEEALRRGLKKDDHSAILRRAQNSIEVGV